MFTLNNYTDKQVAWCTLYSTLDHVTRMTVSREVGESGTPHLQGCITWRSNKTLVACKKLLKAHWTKADSPGEAHAYPVKADSDVFVQVNNKGKGSGERTDMEEMKKEIIACNSLQEVMKVPGVARVRSWAKALWASRPQEGVSIEEFRPWQHKLYLEMLEDADDRKIIWYYDQKGGSGKTTMAMHMVTMGGFYCDNGKTADVVYAYANQRIIVVDIARSTKGRVNYEVIEMLKDGMMFSSKYESHTKIRNEPAHLVVMSNFLPDKSKMSMDRWDIRPL